MLLSQERVAEMSGLSLRTVQRLEAGHRVSYASLRALATTFEIDVDLLELELYAVKDSTDEFVEVPRWIRLSTPRWYGGPHLSRRDHLVIEAIFIVCAVIAFAASFLVTKDRLANALLGCAIALLVACYISAVTTRIGDRYKLWPGSRNAAMENPRTWRTITAEYTFIFGMGFLSVALFVWLVF